MASESSPIITVTDKTFATDVLAAQKLVLVDFWAQWCGPCQAMNPILEQIATENPDICIAKLEVDQNPLTAGQYQIMQIPTLIFFKDGKIVKKLLGAKKKPVILKEIKEIKETTALI